MNKRNGRSRAAAPPPSVRVAIYTRKSTEEGLDQEFNTLDAQRQSVEAYIASQRGEGWVALPERYDDGGFTGANTERPAFQRLLADVEAGKVDVIAVYKIDRLSRSLLDFTRIMDVLDRNGVSFVSVTQQFSTANSMGKLTLNILMSFAEFERETIAERTRDKMRAARRKGLWTGGRPVLGYDVANKKLVVNAAEAELVRTIYRLYQEQGSLLATAEELRRRGVRNKTLTSKRGRTTQGRHFDKNTLRSLLTHPIYVGKMRAGDEVVDGVHAAIVDHEEWDAVQAQLRRNGRAGGSGVRNKWGALLKGLLHCGRCGAPMTNHSTRKDGKLFRYYVCQTAQKRGAAACRGSRAPGGELEAVVVQRIRAIGRDSKLVAATVAAAKRDAEAKRPALVAESRRLKRERGDLTRRRANLITAVGDGAAQPGPLMAEVAELDIRLTHLAERQAQVTAELAELERGAFDEDRLRTALAEFDAVWGTLVAREQARVLQLLVEGITLDPDAGELDITLRSNGLGAASQATARGEQA